MLRRSATYTAVGIALLLSLVGLVLIYSASRRIFQFELLWKQSLWLCLGLVVYFGITRFSRTHIYRSAWPLYCLGILLLALTLFAGTQVRGDRSWLDLGFFNLQASEIMKLCLVLVWARMGRNYSSGDSSRFVTLVTSTAVFLLPLGLILMQPDLGTALVYLGMFAGWFFMVGFWREGALYVTSGLAALSGLFLQISSTGYWFHEWLQYPLQWQSSHRLLLWMSLIFVFLFVSYLIWHKIGFLTGLTITGLSFLTGVQLVPLLEDYQLQRLLVYFNPYSAPLESGYNIIQAQIAIGSGGWFGQGYLDGSQSQLGFIPELWTDFIFSVAVEELGLLFGLALILALGVYVYCFFSVASLSADWEGYYISSGMGLIVLIHVVLNLGVCVGLIPVVGLPLPFLSYGGSFFVTNWLLLGMLSVISRRLSGQALLQSPSTSKSAR